MSVCLSAWSFRSGPGCPFFVRGTCPLLCRVRFPSSVLSSCFGSLVGFPVGFSAPSLSVCRFRGCRFCLSVSCLSVSFLSVLVYSFPPYKVGESFPVILESGLLLWTLFHEEVPKGPPHLIREARAQALLAGEDARAMSRDDVGEMQRTAPRARPHASAAHSSACSNAMFFHLNSGGVMIS